MTLCITKIQKETIMKKAKIGIYSIKNIENNKMYIGMSKDIYTRWKHHKYRLNRGDHSNSYLQSSWNKYKEDSFTFNILEESKCISLLNELEIKYINEHDTTNPEKGYNLTEGGIGVKRVDNFNPKDYNLVVRESISLDIIKGMTTNEKLVFYILRDFCQPKTNCVKINGKTPTDNEVSDILGISKKEVEDTFKLLMQKNLMIRNRAENKIWVNPYIYKCGNVNYSTNKKFTLSKPININETHDSEYFKNELLECMNYNSWFKKLNTSDKKIVVSLHNQVVDECFKDISELCWSDLINNIREMKLGDNLEFISDFRCFPNKAKRLM